MKKSLEIFFLSLASIVYIPSSIKAKKLLELFCKANAKKNETLFKGNASGFGVIISLKVI